MITIDTVLCRIDALSSQASRLLTDRGFDRFRIVHTGDIYHAITKYYKIKNVEPDVPNITNATAKETYLARLLSDIDLAIINAEVKFSNFAEEYGKGSSK